MSQPVRSYVGAYLATLCAHVALEGLDGNEVRRPLRGMPFPAPSPKRRRALCLSLEAAYVFPESARSPRAYKSGVFPERCVGRKWLR